MNWYALLKLSQVASGRKAKNPSAPSIPPAKPQFGFGGKKKGTPPPPSFLENHGLTPPKYDPEDHEGNNALYAAFHKQVGALDDQKFQELFVPDYEDFQRNRAGRDFTREIPPIPEHLKYDGKPLSKGQGNPLIELAKTSNADVIRFCWHPFTGEFSFGQENFHNRLPINKRHDQVSLVRGFFFPKKGVIALRPYFKPESSMDGFGRGYNRLNTHILTELESRLERDLKPYVPNLTFDTQQGDAAAEEIGGKGNVGSGVSNQYLATKYRDISNRW